MVGACTPLPSLGLEVAGLFHYPRFSREGARARAREQSLRGRLRCLFLCHLAACLLCVRLSRRTCPLGPLGTETGLPGPLFALPTSCWLGQGSRVARDDCGEDPDSHRVARAPTWQPGLLPLPPPSLPSLPGGTSEGRPLHTRD